MEKQVENRPNEFNNLIELKYFENQEPIKKSTHENVVSEEYMEKNKKCTYFLMGEMQIKQNMFICGRCDFYEPSPMCESCYYTCHKECLTKENNLIAKNSRIKKGKMQRSKNYKATMKLAFINPNSKNEQSSSIAQQDPHITANKGKQIFSCLCGKLHKHQIIEGRVHEKKNDVEKKCNLQNDMLPTLFPANKYFFCNDCKINICSLCMEGCHYFHKVVEDSSIDVSCKCSNSNHSMNDFLFNIYFNDKSAPVTYPSLISSNKKVLNMIFIKRELFGNMTNLLKENISLNSFVFNNGGSKVISNKPRESSKNLLNTESNQKANIFLGSKIDENMRKFLDLSEKFFNIFYDTNDKCYFFNDELKKFFSFEKTYKIIEKFCESNYDPNFSPQLVNFIGIFFYLHLKSDFQLYKNFTISDFMGSNICFRMLHKKKIFKMETSPLNGGSKTPIILNHKFSNNSIGGDNIKGENMKKYFNETGSLTKLSLKISNALINYLEELDILEDPNLYVVSLRFISFVIKKMHFTKEELKILTDNLNDFFKDFYIILTDAKNELNMASYIETTKFVFYYLIKISYMIAINYNDIITEELIQEYRITNRLKVEEKRKAYIHSNEEHGDKLLKIIFKTVFLLSESYSNDILIDRKIINICNESIKLFTVSDNFYFNQISNLNEEEALAILRVNEQSKDRTQSEEIQSLSIKLSNKIKSILVDDHSELLDGETLIYLEIDTIFKELINSKSENNSPDNKNGHKASYFFKKNIDKEKERKIINYKEKVMIFLSNVLKYPSKEQFYSNYSPLLFSDYFISNMIAGNFDEIISKYLNLFDYKCLTEKDVNAAFSIYLLYCLDQKGIEHLCTGKNLSIITLLFSNDNSHLILNDEIKIEFLYLLFRGINLYNINLSNHKCIYNLTKISEERLSSLNISAYKPKQRLLKIFMLLKNYLEFEEFEKIQIDIFNKFIKLSNISSFKKYMDEFFKQLEENNKQSNIAYEMQAKELNVLETMNSKKINLDEDPGVVFDQSSKLIISQVFSNKVIDEETNELEDPMIESKNAFNPSIKTEALKFYFSFFKFLAVDNYYILNDIPEQIELLEEIHKFVDLKYMRKILSNHLLPINYRTNLLVFLRTFYFIDLLNVKSKTFDMENLTNEEMHKLTTEENLDGNERELLNKKSHLIFKIIAVMDIFVAELEMFDKMIKNGKFYPIDVKNYLIQIVFSIKIISDFVYYSKSILENVVWYLYKICKRFINKANIIKDILLSLKKNGDIGDITDSTGIENKQMENSDFNVFDKDAIFNLISDKLIEILKETNVDKNFKLERYLKQYDRKNQNDFTPIGVITRNGFDEFYESTGNDNKSRTMKQMLSFYGTEEDEVANASNIKHNDIKKLNDNNLPLKKLIRNIFKRPYVKIFDTCLIRVVNTFKTKDEIVDYRRIIVLFFIKYISSDPENHKFSFKFSNRIYTEKTIKTLLNVIVKLLYYDPKSTQSSFEILNTLYIPPTDNDIMVEEKPLDMCKLFFKSIWNKIGKIFILNFSTSINFFMFERYLEISDLNKLMIQLLQLLAEGFNSSFRSKIFSLELTKTESISIFDVICTQSRTTYNLMDLNQNIANNNELSHYKLIVLFSNIFDFFGEYMDGADNPKDSIKISQMIQNIFNEKMHLCLLMRIEDEMENIKPEKIKLVKKLLLRVKIKIIEILINYMENEVDESFLKRILKELPMTRLFEEIQYYLYELLTNIKNSAILKNDNSFYKNILNVYYYDKITFFETLIIMYLTNDEFTQSLELKFCMKLFIYLKIMSDVHDITTIEDHFNHLRLNKKFYLKNFNFKQGFSKNDILSFLSPHAIKVNKFMKSIVKKVDVKNFEDNKVYKTFFFRPPVTFYLSKLSQRQFLETVNRESRFSKLSSLIRQTDYFMFEMVYYSHFTNLGVRINDFLDLHYLEMFNYFLIILHQIFLLVNYYKSTELAEEEYFISIDDKYNIRTNNFVLSFVQIAYIILVLVLWFFFQFPLKLFNNLMIGDQTFLFNKEGEEKREIIYKFNKSSIFKGTLSHLNFVTDVYKNNSKWQILKSTIFNCLIMNRTINTFFFTFILIILFLTTKSALFIVFPVLFLINIIPILYGMLVALKTKFSQFITMLIFTYICIYFYMWISFYFFYPLFSFDNVYVENQGVENSEKLCISAIECYLTMIDLGFRAGGGIGEDLPLASWKENTSFYIYHFIYKMTFFIFIILILLNSCFGIIIDAFSDLRDKSNAIEEDKKNICYICQISRDTSLNRNINFDKHRNKEHHVWDYVYFITHLLLNDPNDFNKSEYQVWQIFNKSPNDIGWIPGETEEDD